MKKKTYFVVITFLLLSIALFSSVSHLILPHLISYYFNKRFNVDVIAEKARWDTVGRISVQGIEISNRKDLKCSIDQAVISYHLLSMLRSGINFSLHLNGIKLSGPETGIAQNVTDTLSLTPLSALRFDYAKGKIYRKKGELIFKDINMAGKLLRLSADGTVSDDSRIDCSVRVLLSKQLLANIPEATRTVFFKRDGPWSELKLFIAGDIRRPSINFSTDLFKFTVRGSPEIA